MLHTRLLIIVSVCSLLFAVPLVGEEPKKANDSPEDVTRRAMTALRDDRMEDFAKDMHPTALKQLKIMLISVLDVAAEEGHEKDVLRLFKDVRTVEQARKLDDAKFFIAFMSGVLSLKPEMKEVLANAKAEMLGHVMEGGDTAHVVIRMSVSLSGATITKMDVISLKKTDSGWRMMLSGEIDGLAQVLKQKFGGKK